MTANGNQVEGLQGPNDHRPDSKRCSLLDAIEIVPEDDDPSNDEPGDDEEEVDQQSDQVSEDADDALPSQVTEQEDDEVEGVDYSADQNPDPQLHQGIILLTLTVSVPIGQGEDVAQDDEGKRTAEKAKPADNQSDCGDSERHFNRRLLFSISI